MTMIVKSQISNYTKYTVKPVINDKHTYVMKSLKDEGNLNGSIRDKTKIQNFENGYEYMLTLEPLDITPRIIRILHNFVAGDLIASSYRKNIAKPSGGDFEYVDPGDISAKLDMLCRQYRGLYEKLHHNRTQHIYLAASFVSTFLLVHPFSNGNGRTARLLLSIILRPITEFPLYIRDNNKGWLNTIAASRDSLFPHISPVEPDAFYWLLVSHIDALKKN